MRGSKIRYKYLVNKHTVIDCKNQLPINHTDEVIEILQTVIKLYESMLFNLSNLFISILNAGIIVPKNYVEPLSAFFLTQRTLRISQRSLGVYFPLQSITHL
jgi:hypothetical protein